MYFSPHVAEIVFHSFESSVESKTNHKTTWKNRPSSSEQRVWFSSQFVSSIPVQLTLKCNVASFSGQKQLANVCILTLTWRRLANFHLLIFGLYCPLKRPLNWSVELACTKSPPLPVILSFYTPHLPFLPLFYTQAVVGVTPAWVRLLFCSNESNMCF